MAAFFDSLREAFGSNIFGTGSTSHLAVSSQHLVHDAKSILRTLNFPGAVFQPAASTTSANTPSARLRGHDDFHHLERGHYHVQDVSCSAGFPIYRIDFRTPSNVKLQLSVYKNPLDFFASHYRLGAIHHFLSSINSYRPTQLAECFRDICQREPLGCPHLFQRAIKFLCAGAGSYNASLTPGLKKVSRSSGQALIADPGITQWSWYCPRLSPTIIPLGAQLSSARNLEEEFLSFLSSANNCSRANGAVAPKITSEALAAVIASAATQPSSAATRVKEVPASQLPSLSSDSSIGLLRSDDVPTELISDVRLSSAGSLKEELYSKAI